MTDRAIVTASLIAGVVSLACGLLAILGYTDLRLGAAVGTFNFGGARNPGLRLGLALGAIGVLLAIGSLLR